MIVKQETAHRTRLIELCTSNLGDMIMSVNLICSSMLFAVKLHGEQKYGRKPYHTHLIDVVNVLRRFIDWDDLTQDLVDAAWLHDVVEDTDVKIEELEFLFGPRVAELVFAVTNEPAENRKEKYAKTYPKIRAVNKAVTIKLADRIANIEQSISHDRFGRPPQKLFSMYEKEWDSFVAELKGRCSGEGEVEEAMWKYLAELMQEGREKVIKYKNLMTFGGEV